MNIELEMPSYEMPQITDLTVALEPVQDLHGYDSPWPAGGGKNLIPAIAQTKTQNGVTFTVNADGTLTVNGTATGRAYVYVIAYNNFLPNGEYTCSVSGVPSTQGANSPFVNLSYSDNGTTYSGSYGSVTGNNSRTYTVSHQYSAVLFDVPAGNVFNNNVIKVQIEAGSTATAWTPYSNICPISGRTSATIYHSGADTSNPTEYEIPFSTSVYGGTLDVLTGVLTVEWENIDSYAGETLPGEWMSDRDVYASGTTPTTGAQVVYKLATPTTVQLTAQEVETLTGINNVWSDSGDVTVTISGTTQTGDVVTVTALPQHKIQLFMP